MVIAPRPARGGREEEERMVEPAAPASPPPAAARERAAPRPPGRPGTTAAAPAVKIRCRGVNVFYGETHALKNVDLDITANEITARRFALVNAT